MKYLMMGGCAGCSCRHIDMLPAREVTVVYCIHYSSPSPDSALTFGYLVEGWSQPLDHLPGLLLLGLVCDLARAGEFVLEFISAVC